MVKNQKKPLVAASRDELLCVALPVIHGVFLRLGLSGLQHGHGF